MLMMLVVIKASLIQINDIDNISWDGYLSRGVHLIELRVTDNRMEHGGQMSMYSELITIDNSVPKAVIEDQQMIPKDFIDTQVIEKVNVNKVKEELKKGASVQGARLVQETRLDIK